MRNGGKRKGAGVKEGSIRPNFFAFVTPEEIREYLDWVKANYKNDNRIAVWYGDHLFGKALQPLGNEDGSPLTIKFDSTFNATS